MRAAIDAECRTRVVGVQRREASYSDGKSADARAELDAEREVSACGVREARVRAGGERES